MADNTEPTEDETTTTDAEATAGDEAAAEAAPETSGGTTVGSVVFDDRGVATLPSGAKIIAPAFAKSTPQERQQEAARRYEEWLASNPDEDEPPIFYDA